MMVCGEKKEGRERREKKKEKKKMRGGEWRSMSGG